MFTSKQKNFGVLKIDSSTVKVYESLTQSCGININKTIEDARWTGDTITVWLIDGEVRKYSTLSQYSIVR